MGFDFLLLDQDHRDYVWTFRWDHFHAYSLESYRVAYWRVSSVSGPEKRRDCELRNVGCSLGPSCRIVGRVAVNVLSLN